MMNIKPFPPVKLENCAILRENELSHSDENFTSADFTVEKSSIFFFTYGLLDRVTTETRPLELQWTAVTECNSFSWRHFRVHVSSIWMTLTRSGRSQQPADQKNRVTAKLFRYVIISITTAMLQSAIIKTCSGRLKTLCEMHIIII